jgi:hypothetical protein
MNPREIDNGIADKVRGAMVLLTDGSVRAVVKVSPLWEARKPHSARRHFLSLSVA